MANMLEGPGKHPPVHDPIQDCPHCRRSYKLSVIRKLLESEADEFRNVACVSRGCGGDFSIGPPPTFRITPVRPETGKLARPSARLSRSGVEPAVADAMPVSSGIVDNAKTTMGPGGTKTRVQHIESVKARIRDEASRQVLYHHRYQAVSVLGEGGSGIVIKANDTEAKRPIALKFHVDTSLDDLEGEIARARATRALRVQGMFDNPHVPKPLGSFDHPEYGVVTIEECITGISLMSEIDRLNTIGGCVPESEVRIIARQIAEVLAIAYDLRVVHRDIKPHNIILTSRAGLPLAYVIDWGLARVEKAAHIAGREPPSAQLNRWNFVKRMTLKRGQAPAPAEEIEDLSVSLTNKRDILGTPQYLSPEIVKDCEADHRSDLYSLGVTLYHLLTGGPPFFGESLKELVRKALNDEPEFAWVAANRRGITVTRDFSALVSKLMAKDPDERFQSAKSFIRSLDELPVVKITARRSRDVIGDSAARMGGRGFFRGFLLVALLAIIVAAAVYFRLLSSWP